MGCAAAVTNEADALRVVSADRLQRGQDPREREQVRRHLVERDAATLLGARKTTAPNSSRPSAKPVSSTTIAATMPTTAPSLTPSSAPATAAAAHTGPNAAPAMDSAMMMKVRP